MVNSKYVYVGHNLLGTPLYLMPCHVGSPPVKYCHTSGGTTLWEGKPMIIGGNITHHTEISEYMTLISFSHLFSDFVDLLVLFTCILVVAEPSDFGYGCN